MIILDDVCFAYDDRPILSHLTERIEPGQAVLLTGPNGSGKSTPAAVERPYIPAARDLYL